MDIKKIQTMKVKLNHDIEKLLIEFSDRTSLVVDDIEVDVAVSADGRITECFVLVEIKI